MGLGLPHQPHPMSLLLPPQSAQVALAQLLLAASQALTNIYKCVALRVRQEVKTAATPYLDSILILAQIIRNILCKVTEQQQQQRAMPALVIQPYYYFQQLCVAQVFLELEFLTCLITQTQTKTRLLGF